MTDDRAEMRAARDAGLKARHENRLARAQAEIYYCPTAGEMEMHPGGGFDGCCNKPFLHEPVLPVVFAAIRREVAEEIAQAIEAKVIGKYPTVSGVLHQAASIAREIGSKEAGE